MVFGMRMLVTFRNLTEVYSSDWIATEFNNQNAPSSFYTLGSEIIAGGSQDRVWDSGTIALTVNGSVIATTSYGSESTPGSIAAGLAAGVVSGAPVIVTADNGALKL